MILSPWIALTIFAAGYTALKGHVSRNLFSSCTYDLLKYDSESFALSLRIHYRNFFVFV